MTTAVLVLCAATLFGCEVDLYRDLSERRANEALLALREAGLRAEKHLEERSSGGRPSSFVLAVPRSEEARALFVLGQRGLPRLPEPASAGGSKLLFSPLEQRSETAAALSLSLTDTLERLPEVAEARVHLALPELEPLSPFGSPRPTASVLLKLRAPLPLRPGQVAELVARAVPGLDVQDVAVVEAPAAAVKVASATAPPLSAIGPLLVAPESRPVALFLCGLVVVLFVVCGVLLRFAWPRSSPSTRPQ